MRLGRILILIALILIAILGGVFVFFQFIATGQPAEEPVQVEMINIVIVQQPISRGGVITEEALGTIEYPRDQVVEGLFTDLNAVVGKRAKFDLDPPIPITSGMVVDNIGEISEVGSDAALLIPQGMVAVSVPISRFSSVAYGVQVGDHVNVISTMLFVDLDTEFQTALPNNTSAVIAPGPKVLIGAETEEGATAALQEADNLTAQIASGGSVSPQGRAELDPVLNQPFYLVPGEPTQRPRMVSQTLLQDIVVLHVGTFLVDGEDVTLPAPPPTEEGEEPPPPEVQPPDIITLIVTPQDAVTLNYLVYAGAELNLALRSGNDDSRVFTEAVTLQFLLDQYNIPVPVKTSFGIEPRLDVLTPPVLENDRE